MSDIRSIASSLGDSAQRVWSNGGKAYLASQHMLLPLSKEITRLVQSTADSRPNLKILDVACGTGQPSVDFAQTFPHADITATDFAPGMVESAKSFAAGQGVKNIQFSVADAQDLSAFESDSFDVLSCVAAIFAIPDAKQALREFKRVLKPGGKCFVTTWGSPHETNFATSVFAAKANLVKQTEQPPKQQGLELNKPEVFLETVTECGFSNAQISDFNCHFEFTDSELGEFREHPMMASMVSMMTQAGFAEEDAYEQLSQEVKAIARQNDWVQGDKYQFPVNVAYIVVAEA